MRKRALIAVPIVGMGIAALAACSPATTPAAAPAPSTTAPVLSTTASSAPAPTTTTTSSAPKGTPAADTGNGCKVNPATAAVPTADPYQWVPKADQMQVSLSPAPATVRVAGTPIEVDVTFCNDSPVDYPQAGFVFALDRGSAAPAPLHIAEGAVQRYEKGQWVTQQYPHVGNDPGYLGQFFDQQPMPKGKSVTIRYRFAYDAKTMGNGTGGVVAAVVTPDPNSPNVLGAGKASYTVVK
ncbi:hypothetical protein [Kutzneria sp. NPDC052558]|uniref:hypothetical protein n=1 Tax=Kutzneria sp. NPDC052558 TaxID=3364121 RepID=UPI0037CB3BBF